MLAHEVLLSFSIHPCQVDHGPWRADSAGQSNHFVLITAASSSVGIAAIEIARAEGTISIATTRTSQKKAELLTLGADYVIATE